MIQSEKLKKFFLHQDPQIRQQAARYFYDGCILDPQILPLTIQSYRQYSTEKDVLMLFYAGRQMMDDTSAQQLFELLRETEDELLEMHLTRLLTQASLGFLSANLEQMQTYGEQKLWKAASNRLEFAQLSPEHRWQKLIDYSKQYCGQDADAMVSAPLVQSLADCDIPDTDQICQLLTDPSVIGQWIEIFLIELAALRKIAPAIPIIIDKLQQDDFMISDACSKALSRIGTETTVQILKEKCITGNWGIQLSAACILGDIKLPQSEQAIIDLLDNHKGHLPHDIYCHLCFSLCDLLSNKAFHYGKAILDDIEATEFDSMRQRLMTLAVVFGTPLSPQVVRQWKREIALEPMRRREYMRKTRPELYRMSQQLRDRFTDEPDDALPDELEMNDEYVAPPSHLMAGDTPKTGRNETCPCGSGKKYKKCCGK